MIQFQWLWAFAALPLPLLARWLLPRAPLGRAGALKVPFYQDLDDSGLAAKSGRGGRLWRLALLVLIWALLVAAAARPAYVGAPVPIPVDGRDIMMAVDLSGSMQREDFALDGLPTDRLTVIKSVADDFINRRNGDRVGLILFGTRAYVQAPLTFDRKVVRELLDSATIGLPGPETAIGDAIALAVKTLRTRPEDERVLILLTDGANNAGMLDPLQAAELAKRAGVKIYTIGVGASSMAVGSRVVNPAADLDEAALAQIADMTGGRYFRARDTAGLAAIYQDIDRMEPAAGEPRYLYPSVSLFYLPLGAALALAVLLGLILAAPLVLRRPAASTAMPEALAGPGAPAGQGARP